VLDRHRRPALGFSVERLDLVEPFAFAHSLLEIEAGGGGIASRPAAAARLDWHVSSLCDDRERNKNIADELTVGASHSGREGRPAMLSHGLERWRLFAVDA